MAELKTKENAYVECPSPTILTEISAIRTTLDNLLTQDEEVKVRFIRQKFYEHGDKPGKYESQTIAALCDDCDKLHL